MYRAKKCRLQVKSFLEGVFEAAREKGVYDVSELLNTDPLAGPVKDLTDLPSIVARRSSLPSEDVADAAEEAEREVVFLDQVADADEEEDRRPYPPGSPSYMDRLTSNMVLVDLQEEQEQQEKEKEKEPEIDEVTGLPFPHGHVTYDQVAIAEEEEDKVLSLPGTPLSMNRQLSQSSDESTYTSAGEYNKRHHVGHDTQAARPLRTGNHPRRQSPSSTYDSDETAASNSYMHRSSGGISQATTSTRVSDSVATSRLDKIIEQIFAEGWHKSQIGPFSQKYDFAY